MKLLKWAGKCLLGTMLMTAAAVSSAGSDETPGVETIYNFHRVDDTLLTSGQLTEAHAVALKEDAIGLVINLATADKERNGEEAFWLANQGIAYTQIPVVWSEPTFADLDLFFAIMDARAERRVLVHCFANFRASAFTYLYRTLRLGVPEAEARADLEAIWTEKANEEYPQWVTFMADAKARDQSKGSQ